MFYGKNYFKWSVSGVFAVLAILTVGIYWVQGSDRQAHEPIEGVAKIFPGDSSLDPSVIAPHSATYRMSQATGGESTFFRDVHPTIDQNGKPAVGVICKFQFGPQATFDVLAWDAKSFGLSYRLFPAGKAGQFVINLMNGNQFSGSLTPFAGGEPKKLAAELPHSVFDTAQLDFLIAALPLEKGYHIQLPMVRPLQGTLYWAEVRVTGRESVSAPTGKTYETWKVEVKFTGMSGTRTFWISKQAPYRIKAQLGNTTYELMKLEQ